MAMNEALSPSTFATFAAALTINISQHHLPAFADQPGSNAQANAPRSTGDQRHTAVVHTGSLDH
jgi:hypothetical protein